jgi:hypothetical protein
VNGNIHGTANPSWSKAKHAARVTHLDEDAAGRLLESSSDRTPREMTVTVRNTTGQNPAYRLIPRLISGSPSRTFPGRAVLISATCL